MDFIQRSHEIRLYPTKAQEIQLSKTAGTARYAYNQGIARCEEAYKAGEKHPTGYDLRAWWVDNHPDWADEVAASCVYSSFLHVDAAYKRFFRERKGHPHFHKKGVHDSFNVAGDKGKVVGKRVRIPGVGYVKMAEELRFKSAKINSYSVSRRAGIWFVSVQCVIEDTRVDIPTAVGVDVGCKNWAVASSGIVLKAPEKLAKLRKKLQRQQRSLSRKKKGSNNRRKDKLAVAKTYLRIDNIKSDAIHKFTSTITKNHGVVAVEDLNVESMREKGVKSTRKGIQNSAMSEILRQLSYKANTVVKVARYYPSSKRCSNCGNVKEHLELSDRIYYCEKCGSKIDRDLNASLNILQEGLRLMNIAVGHTALPVDTIC